MNLKVRARKLKQDIPMVFLCLKDAETSVSAKILAAVTVGYALSSVDFIPDFIPVLGYLDDAILLPALIAWTIRLIPKDVWARNAVRSAGMWADGKPKKWYYAIPIVLVWVLVLWVVLKCFL